jgi:glycerol-3-phosphate dehydrogenase
MIRRFGDLESRQFDLLVIGGGIFGACAAWDAALRGLAVALVEQTDFGSGTSANSFKIVHGGIRYLQHADLPRLRASCHERSALLRIAPHLVSPLPIVVPTYGRAREGKALLGAGMLLYDTLTLDRNRGIEPERRIPWSGFLRAAEVLDLFPGIERRGLTGAAVFCDGQMYNPPRLVLAFARSAAEHGALIVNYAEAVRLTRAGDTVTGAEVQDRLTGAAAQVRARAVLNAGGPWVPWFMSERERAPLADAGNYSRDACFVIRRRFPHPYGLALQGRTRDPDAVLARRARHLFVVPWRQYTLCGVWHRVARERPQEVELDAAEVAAFVEELNGAMPSLGIDPAEISTFNFGLLPFGDNEPGAAHLRYGKRSHILDHAAESGLRNLVSLIGVRYTMARGDAALAVDLVCAKLGRRNARPPTDRMPVSGGGFGGFGALVDAAEQAAPFAMSRSVAVALAHNHGGRYRDVLEFARRAELAGCIAGTTTLRAEVVHAVQTEMAQRLTDIVFRRTDLASGAHPGRQALEEAATLAGAQLGWSPAKRSAEIAEVERASSLRPRTHIARAAQQVAS